MPVNFTPKEDISAFSRFQITDTLMFYWQLTFSVNIGCRCEWISGGIL